MADDSPALPTTRIARWTVIGAVIVLTLALYFRDGRQVPPLNGTPAAGPAPANQPAN